MWLFNKEFGFWDEGRGPIAHEVKLVDKGWGDKETVVDKES